MYTGGRKENGRLRREKGHDGEVRDGEEQGTVEERTEREDGG